MGTAIALREKTPLVPRTPENETDLLKELRDYESKLDVRSRLRAYGAALRRTSRRGSLRQAHYYLVVLEPSENRVAVKGYRSSESRTANDEYLAIERSIQAGERAGDAVLVSVDSISALKRAFPNYFLDTRRFLEAVTAAVGN